MTIRSSCLRRLLSLRLEPPIRILHAATSQRLKPSLRLKPPPPHAIDLDEVVPSVTEEEEKEQRAETKDVDNLMALLNS